MTLHEGRLRARDRAGRDLFDVTPAQVGGRLSRLGTLLLDVAGRDVQLVGRGGAQSPAPGPEQRRELADFQARHPVPPPAHRPGVFDQLLNGSAAWRMRCWRDALVAAGAPVRR